MGRGTTFVLRFPLLESVPEADPEPELPVSEISRSAEAKVLVVDDDDAIRTVVRRILSGLLFAAGVRTARSDIPVVLMSGHAEVDLEGWPHRARHRSV